MEMQRFKPTISNLDDLYGENIYSMIVTVRRVLTAAGQLDAVKEFLDRVTEAQSCDEAFSIAREYVETES